MNDAPHILLVGAGAVGAFYCGKLQQAGARVTVVARSDYDAVRGRGYRVTSCLGDFTFNPDGVVRSAAEYGRAAKCIVVATKALPSIDVPALIRDAVGPDTVILMLQNGIGIEEPVAAAFPENEILSGLAFICVSRIGPAIIDHQDYGRIVIGRYPDGASAMAERLAALFNAAGVPCAATDNVTRARWLKLVWNAPFNPVSVLAHGADTREMLSGRESREFIRGVMAEVLAIAEKTGNSLPESVIQKNLDDTFAMKPYKTSMLLDYENGREMEVEAILGNPVRVARGLGLQVPRMESLYALLGLINERLKGR